MQAGEIQSQPPENFFIKTSGDDYFRLYHGRAAYVEIAKATIHNGGRVLFVHQEYDNAPSKTVKCISTLAEIDVWEHDLHQAPKQVRQS